MNLKNLNYSKRAVTVIIISTLMRLAAALIPELSAHESYYRSLVIFPQLESLRSPPVIGWLIQLFTNNLLFDTPFFIRTAAIFCGTVSMWVLYITAKKISGEKAGFYSVLLFAASLYLSFGTGMLALPEAPATLFFLTAIYFFSDAFNPRKADCPESYHLCSMAIILAGVFAGLAVLSKFSMIIIWPAIFTYALLNKREYFNRASFYISFLISFLFLLPFYLWNSQSNFIIEEAQLFSLNIGISLTELILIFLFILLINNPFNIIIISKSLFCKKTVSEKAVQTGKMSVTLTLFFILYHLLTSERSVDTALSGFAASDIFTPLIIAGGIFCSESQVVKSLKRALCFSVVSVILFSFQFYTGYASFNFLKKPGGYTPGKFDPTLRFFGGEQIESSFSNLYHSDITEGLMSNTSYILESDFYRAYYIDYYIGSKLPVKIKTIDGGYAHGGNLKEGDYAYYFSFSTCKNLGLIDFGNTNFEKVEKGKIFYIYRLGMPAVRVTVYRFINFLSTQ